MCEYTRKYLEVMQAFLAGKPIQSRRKRGNYGWELIRDPVWNFGDFNYRVKPPESKWNSCWTVVNCNGAPVIHSVSKKEFAEDRLAQFERNGASPPYTLVEIRYRTYV